MKNLLDLIKRRPDIGKLEQNLDIDRLLTVLENGYEPEIREAAVRALIRLGQHSEYNVRHKASVGLAKAQDTHILDMVLEELEKCKQGALPHWAKEFMYVAIAHGGFDKLKAMLLDAAQNRQTSRAFWSTLSHVLMERLRYLTTSLVAPEPGELRHLQDAMSFFVIRPPQRKLTLNDIIQVIGNVYISSGDYVPFDFRDIFDAFPESEINDEVVELILKGAFHYVDDNPYSGIKTAMDHFRRQAKRMQKAKRPLDK